MMEQDKKHKGILKNSTSFDKPQGQSQDDKRMKWDEMNILATYHPPDKEYGHMKIDDPPTPYHPNEEDSEEDLDPENLASRLSDGSKPREFDESVGGGSSGEELEEDSPEQRERRASFEQKRKMHYNEFQAIKLARKLLEEEEEEEEGDNEIKDNESKEEESKEEDQSPTSAEETKDN